MASGVLNGKSFGVARFASTAYSALGEADLSSDFAGLDPNRAVEALTVWHGRGSDCESLTSSKSPKMFATWKYRSASRQARRPWVVVPMTTWSLISLESMKEDDAWW